MDANWFSMQLEAAAVRAVDYLGRSAAGCGEADWGNVKLKLGKHDLKMDTPYIPSPTRLPI